MRGPNFRPHQPPEEEKVSEDAMLLHRRQKGLRLGMENGTLEKTLGNGNQGKILADIEKDLQKHLQQNKTRWEPIGTL